MIRLEKIDYIHEKDIVNAKNEYDENNDDYNGAFFIKDILNYKGHIQELNDYSNGICKNKNFVPYTCYLVYHGDKLIGFGSLRHELNDYLFEFGGHIGYSVTPKNRNKGYGTLILKELLKEAKKKKIDKVLVTCNIENIASIKIIEKNSGFLENIVENNGIKTCRYWINNE